jgi:hypothetical protein
MSDMKDAVKRILFCFFALALTAGAKAGAVSDASCISSFCLDDSVTDKSLVDTYGPGLLVRDPKLPRGHARCYYLAEEDAWVEMYFNEAGGDMVGLLISRLLPCAEKRQPARHMSADFMNGRIRLGMSEAQLLGAVGKPSQTIPSNTAADLFPLVDPARGDVVQIYLASSDWCHLVYLKNGQVVGFEIMPPI